MHIVYVANAHEAHLWPVLILESAATRRRSSINLVAVVVEITATVRIFDID